MIMCPFCGEWAKLARGGGADGCACSRGETRVRVMLGDEVLADGLAHQSIRRSVDSERRYYHSIDNGMGHRPYLVRRIVVKSAGEPAIVYVEALPEG